MAAAAAAATDPETYIGMFVGRILAALCSIFVAECLTLSVFAVEVTQPAGAAHGYPGLYDASGKKLATGGRTSVRSHHLQIFRRPVV